MKQPMKIMLLLCLAMLLCTLLLTACDNGGNEQDSNSTTAETQTSGNKDPAQTDAETQPDQHTHAFGEWTVTKQPTCLGAGEQECTCSCGEKQTQAIPELGHTEAIDQAIAPTCTEDGLTEGKHCSVCNDTLVAQEPIAATGHTPADEWKIVKQPTTVEDGEQQQICSVCEDVLASEILPALGSQGLVYAINPDGVTCTVMGRGSCTDSEIVIPSVIDSYTVIAIERYAFSYDDALTALKIPGSVQTIGESAFWGCDALESITLAEGLKEIEYEAFMSCDALTSVTLPSTVTYVSSSAFVDGSVIYREYEGCYYLGTEENPYLILIKVIDSDITSATVHEDCRIIADYAFSSCGNLTELTLGQNVTTICSDAFYRCDSLQTLTIPDSVTEIGESAFYGCSSLTELHIGASLTHIGDRVFESCTSLVSVTVPETVKSIGYRAFARCSKLETISLPDGIEIVEDSAFGENGKLLYTKLQNGYYLGNEQNPFLVLMNVDGYQSSFTVHEDCKVIGGNAFENHSYLKSIEIPEGIVSIGSYAFSYCTKLESVTIPSGVSYIGNNAFSHCVALEELVLPEGIVSIGESTFYRCTSLTQITIPGSVTVIGKNAFEQCESLTAVIIPDGVTEICEYAFYGCCELANLTLPAQLKIIGDFAFADCDSLVTLTLPEGTTYIGSSAFASCNLLSDVSIPDGIVYVSSYAFDDCYELLYTVHDVGYYLGNEQNPYLVLMYTEGWEATEAEVHEDCRVIVSYAFDSCYGMQSIKLPAALLNIGDCAFDSCSDLENVLYEGDESQWALLRSRIPSGNDYLYFATVQCGSVYEY